MSAAPDLADHVHDIQAVVGTGFGWLTRSRFWLLEVGDIDRAREWLARCAGSGLLWSVGAINAQGSNARRDVGEAVALAFSYEGLSCFGIRESTEFPFSTAFRSGMGSQLRADLLRDTGRAQWRWSDTPTHGRQTVHVLLGHWWRDGTTPKLPDPTPAFKQAVRIEGCSSFFRPTPSAKNAASAAQGRGAPLKLYEPFGFRDGIAQPVVYGLRDETAEAHVKENAGELFEDRVVAQGEFIFGYRNEYQQLSYVPDVAGWSAHDPETRRPIKFGLNASLLGVRQIEQDVEAFRSLLPRPTGCLHAPSPAEKMIGRLYDGAGTPLVWRGAEPPKSDSEADAFRYRVDDIDGFACPRGAHIRRANPRDALGHDSASGIRSSKLHRLIRRGRPYQEPVVAVPADSVGVAEDGKTHAEAKAKADDTANMPIDARACAGAGVGALVGQKPPPATEAGSAPTARPKQGLFFIACNADLERQFEFVLQRWLHNERFADLDEEDDPVLGSHRPQRPQRPMRRFSVPGQPTGKAISIASYTTTLGGGYFLLPGIAALGFILRDPARAPAADAA